MSDQQPTISMVIPAYNTEAFLGRAIRSALNQTRPPDEIIVVDDGSTDGTEAIARQFGPSVCYVRQDNSGPAAARNRGICEACGEFVAFLDADDEWLPHHLQTALETFKAHPELQWFVVPHEQRGPGGYCRTFQAVRGDLPAGWKLLAWLCVLTPSWV